MVQVAMVTLGHYYQSYSLSEENLITNVPLVQLAYVHT